MVPIGGNFDTLLGTVCQTLMGLPCGRVSLMTGEWVPNWVEGDLHIEPRGFLRRLCAWSSRGEEGSVPQALQNIDGRIQIHGRGRE